MRYWVEFKRSLPCCFAGGRVGNLRDVGPRTRQRFAIAKRFGYCNCTLPCGNCARGVAAGSQYFGLHFVTGGIVGRQAQRGGKFTLGTVEIADMRDQNIGESQAQRCGFVRLRCCHRAGPPQFDQLRPTAFIGEPLGHPFGGFNRAWIIFECELKELRCGAWVQHAQ